MAFVSLTDPTQPLTSPVTGVFNSPQNSPLPVGYIGHLDDNDSRIAEFLAAQDA